MLAANGAATPLVEADGSRLPFVDGAFDGLVCGYALRNFTDLAATLAEAARVLRPGRPPRRARGRRSHLARSGAPATTSGSPRRSPPSGAPSPTRRPTATCRARWPTCPPPRCCAACCSRRASPASASGPWRAASASSCSPPAPARRDGLRSTPAPWPLEYGPDALQFDGSPTVLFDRPGLTLVGWGTAIGRGRTRPPRRWRPSPATTPCAARARAPWRWGRCPSSTPSAGHLVIPRFTMGISRDADGVTRRWATAVGPADTRAARDRRALRRGHLAVRRHRPTSTPTAGVAGLTTPMTAAGYGALVARRRGAHGRARAPRCARWSCPAPSPSGSSGPLPLSAVLRRLRAGEPNCTIFSMPVPDGAFFGASPELLVARHGGRVSCHPLAGTVARGDTARPRRRRPAGPGRVGQEPRGAPLRGRRDRRRPGARSATSCRCPTSPRWSPSARWPTSAPGSKGGWPGRSPVLELLAAVAPDPGRGRHARAPTPWPSSRGTKRASAATGPGRSAGSAPTATGNG